MGGRQAARKKPAKTTAPRSHARSASPLLTRRELASTLNVVMSAVTKWEHAGLPIAERGRAGLPSRYRLAQVREWLAARETAARTSGPNLAEERARKERAQAALTEQTRAIRAKEYLLAADVEKVWAAHVAAVRAKLLAVPATRADALHRAGVLDGVAGVEDALSAAMMEVLRELVALTVSTPAESAA